MPEVLVELNIPRFKGLCGHLRSTNARMSSFVAVTMSLWSAEEQNTLVNNTLLLLAMVRRGEFDRSPPCVSEMGVGPTTEMEIEHRFAVRCFGWPRNWREVRICVTLDRRGID